MSTETRSARPGRSDNGPAPGPRELGDRGVRGPELEDESVTEEQTEWLVPDNYLTERILVERHYRGRLGYRQSMDIKMAHDLVMAKQTISDQLRELEDRNTELFAAEEMLKRAAETLREIADCDEGGHTGMTWTQHEARKNEAWRLVNHIEHAICQAEGRRL